MKIDDASLKLLEILAQNCRISHAALARCLRVSKDTVRYRIQQLEDSKLLEQYVLFIDARKLGFTRYHSLIQFKDSFKLARTCKELANHEFVMWINSFIGRFDLQIIVDAVDGFHLDQIRKELFAICNHEIKDYSILTHLADLEFTQLNPVLDFRTNFERTSDQTFTQELSTRSFPVPPEFTTVTPDLLDVSILKTLADNSTSSLTTIAADAGCEPQTAKRHIARLISSGVILNFGGIPNLSKLGFITYYLLVRLTQDISYDEMRRPFLELNNIFYAGKMLGDYDMILYLNARNPDELNSSIQLFRSKLQDKILNYDLLVQDQVHHWRQFTPGVFRVLRKELEE